MIKKENSAAPLKICKHFVSTLITFEGRRSYYSSTPTKYVQKCLLCEQISDYCLNPAAAYTSLMAKPTK